MRCFSAAAVLAAALATSSPTLSSGMQGHMYVSELALADLPPGELRDLLTERRTEWLNGSFFPDSGYAANDPYGEMAHWEQFVEGYLQWIRARHEPPFTGEAAAHVAVLMGAASHGMEDQTFDILLVDKAKEMDGDTSELDTGIDVFLVNDRDRRENPEAVVDTAALAQVFADDFDHAVSPATIEDGMATAKSGLSLVINVLAKSPSSFEASLPWTQASYLREDVPGSYPWDAKVVRRYWEHVWRRLHGGADPTGLVVGASPADGAVDVGVDHASVDSYVTLFVGEGLVPETVTLASVEVRGPDGEVVPCSLRTRGDAWVSTIQLRPEADWQFRTTYAVRLARSVVTLGGASPAEDFTLSFTTACAPDDRASCAPKAVAPAAEAGEVGCHVAAPGARSAGSLALATAMLGLVAGRLRRRPGAWRRHTPA